LADEVAETSAELHSLKVEFAEFRGELRSEFKNLAHDVKNLTTKMDAQSIIFVPRNEIEQMHKAMDGRMTAVEKYLFWAWTAGAGFALTVAAGVLVAWFKTTH
jgi:hypothetical protein